MTSADAAALLLPLTWVAVIAGLAATWVLPERSARRAGRRLGADEGRRRHQDRAAGPPRRPLLTSRPAVRRRREAAIADAIPDVIDLFAVAAAAGLNPRLAVEAVAERAPPGLLAEALADVCRRVTSQGARLADALDTVPDAIGSDAVRPLISALTDAERYGGALGPTLERLADDARRSRQRRAEEAARKLPVKLLFPLVVCILPAFGLLTVAPLIAGGLRALRL